MNYPRSAGSRRNERGGCRGLVAAMLLTLITPAVAHAEWVSLPEIRRFSLSLGLTEFPVTQKQYFEWVGMPKGAQPLWGAHDKRGVFQIYALTNPEGDQGYYAVRIYYGARNDNPDLIPVTHAELLFVSPTQVTFVAEQGTAFERILPELKVRMQQKGLSPRDCAEQFMSSPGWPNDEIDHLSDPAKAAQSNEASAH